MKAYNGDPEFKAAFLRQLDWHYEQDKIVSGTYGTEFTNGDFRGCAIGCSIHSLARMQGRSLNTGEHAVLAAELNIPVSLCYLEDRLFEGLSGESQRMWPKRFADAIQPGADLSLVWDKMFLWSNIEHQKLLKPEYRASLDGIIGLWEKRAEGILPSQEESHAVASALRADRSDIADIADIAYRADIAYIAYITDIAYRADIAYIADIACRAELYSKQSEHLLELLASAPIEKETQK